jgi:hypothetical protein
MHPSLFRGRARRQSRNFAPSLARADSHLLCQELIRVASATIIAGLVARAKNHGITATKFVELDT